MPSRRRRWWRRRKRPPPLSSRFRHRRCGIHTSDRALRILLPLVGRGLGVGVSAPILQHGRFFEPQNTQSTQRAAGRAPGSPLRGDSDPYPKPSPPCGERVGSGGVSSEPAAWPPSGLNPAASQLAPPPQPLPARGRGFAWRFRRARSAMCESGSSLRGGEEIDHPVSRRSGLDWGSKL